MAKQKLLPEVFQMTNLCSSFIKITKNTNSRRRRRRRRRPKKKEKREP
jgi:hypothetical protein